LLPLSCKKTDKMTILEGKNYFRISSAIDTAYTINPFDYYGNLITNIWIQTDTTTAPISIILPDLGTLDGRFNLKMNVVDIAGSAAANNITINTSGGNLIDQTGTTSVAITNSNSSIYVLGVSDDIWTSLESFTAVAPTPIVIQGTGANSTMRRDTGNCASGIASTVFGTNHTASGSYSTIGGGRQHSALAPFTTISGGYRNYNLCQGSTVGGGQYNCSFQCYTTLSGGNGNSALACFASILGGASNRAGSNFSTIGGGCQNYAGANLSFIGGGICNTLLNGNTAIGSTIAGGVGNNTTGGTFDTVNGTFTVAPACVCTSRYTFIGGGFQNIASGYNTTIGGGLCNTASSYYSVIAGGSCATASGNYSFVGAGRRNITSGTYSAVTGGSNNTASGYYSAILAGAGNTASGQYSAVLAGLSNIASCARSYIVGSNITSDRICTTFVNNLSIKNIPTSSAGLPSGSVYRNGIALEIVP
jgi:hypothetical protein